MKGCGLCWGWWGYVKAVEVAYMNFLRLNILPAFCPFIINFYCLHSYTDMTAVVSFSSDVYLRCILLDSVCLTDMFWCHKPNTTKPTTASLGSDWRKEWKNKFKVMACGEIYWIKQKYLSTYHIHFSHFLSMAGLESVESACLWELFQIAPKLFHKFSYVRDYYLRFNIFSLRESAMLSTCHSLGLLFWDNIPVSYLWVGLTVMPRSDLILCETFSSHSQIMLNHLCMHRRRVLDAVLVSLAYPRHELRV